MGFDHAGEDFVTRYRGTEKISDRSFLTFFSLLPDYVYLFSELL